MSKYTTMQIQIIYIYIYIHKRKYELNMTLSLINLLTIKRKHGLHIYIR